MIIRATYIATISTQELIEYGVDITNSSAVEQWFYDNDGEKEFKTYDETFVIIDKGDPPFLSFCMEIK